jgi:ribosomal protein S18 acetylase RimI-like enzyme
VTEIASRRNSLKLRRARPRDLNALVLLEQEAFRDRRFAGHLISRGSFRRFLTSPSVGLIIADIDGQLAGYVLVLYRAGSSLARMYSIGVDPAFRRRGLARKLLSAAEKHAIAQRCQIMRLEVRADDPGAIALYQTSGYRPFGRHPGYYGDRDALRLQKSLAITTPQSARLAYKSA